MFAALRERKMKRNCFRGRKKPKLIRANFIEFRFFPIIAKSVRDIVNSGKKQNIHVYETKIDFVLFAPDLAIIQALLLLSFENKTPVFQFR